jgi:hypothetical protein
MAIPYTNPFGQNAELNYPVSIQGCTDLVIVASAQNTSCAVTIPGVTNASIDIASIAWSYTTAGNGRITIEDNSGVVIFDQDLAGTKGTEVLTPPFSIPKGDQCIVRLYAVTGATGKMVPRAWYRL